MANKDGKEKKHFFRNFKAELKKVIWPTPKQVVNNTTAVITVVLVTAVIVLVLDLAFEGILSNGLNKLKSSVVKEVINESSEGVEDTNTLEDLGVEAEDSDLADNDTDNSIEE